MAPSVEQLEDRKLMAADVWLTGGVLNIQADHDGGRVDVRERCETEEHESVTEEHEYVTEEHEYVTEESNEFSPQYGNLDGESSQFGEPDFEFPELLSDCDRVITVTGSTEEFDADAVDRIVFFGSDLRDIVLNNTSISSILQGIGGDDYLRGGYNDDEIYGGSGSDILYGLIGNDLLDGNEGHDTLFGGDGKDLLIGGSGNDTLRGENDNDRLFGHAGVDRLYGGAGDDGLFGGLRESPTNNVMLGESGRDRLLYHGHVPPFDNNRTEDVGIKFDNDDSDWTEREIQVVDAAFERLQDRVGGNTWILKDSFSDHALLFIKSGSHNEWKGLNRIWHAGGYHRRIFIREWDELDAAENRGAMSTVTHEIAHNWDGTWGEPNPFWEAFQQLNNQSQDDEDFAYSYGRTNAQEDWATVWQVAFGYLQPANPSELFMQKLAIVNAFLDLHPSWRPGWAG